MTKRLEKKHSRVVKGFDSGATFSFVDITKPTFSTQYTFLSQNNIKTGSFCLAICGFLIVFLQDGFCLS